MWWLSVGISVLSGVGIVLGVVKSAGDPEAARDALLAPVLLLAMGTTLTATFAAPGSPAYLAYLPVMSMLLAAWIVFRLANIEERPAFVKETLDHEPKRKTKPRMAEIAAERRRASAGQR